MEKMMIKEPGDDSKADQPVKQASSREMLMRIIELASTDDLCDEALYEMVKALEKIAEASKRKET
jgi:23S rRNA maturation-related 3'-5' exoribonuclease YhaM